MDEPFNGDTYLRVVQPMAVRVNVPPVPLAPIDPRKLCVFGDWRLICCQSRETLYIGQRIAAFDGRIGTLEMAVPPAGVGYVGDVYLLQHGASHLSQMVPADINAKWIDGDDIP